MSGHDWSDDDTDYAAAVGRTWIVVVISLLGVVLVVGAAIAVGLGLFGLSGMLSLISD
ncbi:hypothetical protein [Streptomyces chattanoogensis]|uniref:hypothetical protein n=1 Tax=Streptomyces chattanoogensis TaxID=66876 RepID=UPI0005D7853D|nr:hypothetical protein T261_4902 [Streptomyces lydicus]